MKLKTLVLLAKWWRRFGKEIEALWRGLLFLNMGWMDEGSRMVVSLGIGCLSCGKIFLRVGNLSGGGEIKVGEGSKVYFRWDDWLGVDPLCLLLPRLFRVMSVCVLGVVPL